MKSIVVPHNSQIPIPKQIILHLQTLFPCHYRARRSVLQVSLMQRKEATARTHGKKLHAHRQKILIVLTASLKHLLDHNLGTIAWQCDCLRRNSSLQLILWCWTALSVALTYTFKLVQKGRSALQASERGRPQAVSVTDVVSQMRSPSVCALWWSRCSGSCHLATFLTD